ncbi:hypothetical protein IMG5_132430 [Ichthyophthirius multifiliis]|uniref:Uncharacterized protein n=1 Tax=Ichthyophthirius multifiliis TaxID=5932 RepID=G0QWH6_ICHMU|nr:hypothetical protein IMG5_132430 [Ichthyophthirius multifiliis]EGR30421.1 hypothetical protein IMG5_132430 [Ichthyophthirius multifiliis]|eukprot:XP_004032008.1 hypothetical protein IMG5_132430 [Ichthyophthirius multifiliis]
MPEQTIKKIEQLESSQPFFDRLIFFDPDIMASLPPILNFFDPVVEQGKVGCDKFDLYFFKNFNSSINLYLIQKNKQINSYCPSINSSCKISKCNRINKKKKIFLIGKCSFHIIKTQKLKFYRLFLYNLFNIPIIITMIWSIRRTMVEESVKSSSFLWVPSLVNIDPYFILPTLAIAGYYMNMQRFITPENKHTIISKIRGYIQILIILWLPLLSNWPAAIQWYVLNNAIYSLIQISLLIHPKFVSFVQPKMLLYQFLLKCVEYDKVQSETLIESINTGEESFKDKCIKEEVLVQQMEQMLKKLNAEAIDEQLKEANELSINDLKF